MLTPPIWGGGASHSTRTCTRCGRAIPSESSICPYCGDGAYYGQPTHDREPLGSLKTIAYLVAILVPAIGFIWGLIWAIDQDPEKKHTGKVMMVVSAFLILLNILAVWLLYAWVIGFTA